MGAGMTIAVNLHPQVKKRGLKEYVESSTEAHTAKADSKKSAITVDQQKPAATSLMARMKWLKTIEQWIRADSGSDKEKMPNIFNIMAQSVDIMEYVNTALMLSYNSPTVLIEPNLIDVETLAFTEAKRIIDEGYEACSRVKNDLIRKIKLWV
jgi:predicted acylesterase/phospholipase RssA